MVQGAQISIRYTLNIREVGRLLWLSQRRDAQAQEAKMTVSRKTMLIRLGRAKVLTRASIKGAFPEVDNPLERYG